MLVVTSSCNDQATNNQQHAIDSVLTDSIAAKLPRPFETESVEKYSNVIGWPADKAPIAPAGFTVTKFHQGLKNPRWIYEGSNGDIFISEANTELKGIKLIEAQATGKAKSMQVDQSMNRITLLRDTNNDGRADLQYAFLKNQEQPFGMLILNDSFYVANTNALWAFPYAKGDTLLNTNGRKVLELPAGGYNNHWTRNIIANRDGTKIYIAIGSASNVGEDGMDKEIRRANILEINPDGSGEIVYAAGLRNPVGMGWEPVQGTLWTVVNERDELGDELVPDYITQVKKGGFYGWPYAYFGPIEDPRRAGENPELVQKTLVPDLAIGAHTASLGLAFNTSRVFPEKYHNGMFIAQHGSWNRSAFSGYKVGFVPFKNGKPSGEMEDFLTGFIADEAKGTVYGRPTGVAVLSDGSLLVTDDTSNTIWHIHYTGDGK